MSTGPRIVVGIDGSRGSAAAARWVAEQSRLTGAWVDAVYVLEPIVPLDFSGAGFTAVSQLDPSHLHRTAHEVVQHVLRDNAPDLDRVHPLVVEHANPGQALLRAARGAAMLVVGAHHHSGLGFLLGSTASGCVRHATCPVVVIPEDWRAAESAAGEREEVMT